VSLLNKRKAREQPRAEINITNLVDVVMVLLVVFMIVAPMLKTGLVIELPRARVADSANSEDKVILVECGKDNAIQINKEPVTRASVEQTIRDLRAKHGDVPVQLRADKNLPTGFTVGLMGEIRAAGVGSIAMEAIQDDNAK
jgi:biopolymer transport protein TolR